MSPQELAIEKATENTSPAEQSERVSWFEKTFPWFFTPKVVANRETGRVLVSPAKPPKKSWRSIARKPGTGCATHMALHMKQGGSFFFKCPCKNIPMPIDRTALMSMLATSHGKEWVVFRVGTESFELSRGQLRAAIQDLEG